MRLPSLRCRVVLCSVYFCVIHCEAATLYSLATQTIGPFSAPSNPGHTINWVYQVADGGGTVVRSGGMGWGTATTQSARSVNGATFGGSMTTAGRASVGYNWDGGAATWLWWGQFTQDGTGQVPGTTGTYDGGGNPISTTGGPVGPDGNPTPTTKFSRTDTINNTGNTPLNLVTTLTPTNGNPPIVNRVTVPPGSSTTITSGYGTPFNLTFQQDLGSDGDPNLVPYTGAGGPGYGVGTGTPLGSNQGSSTVGSATPTTSTPSTPAANGSQSGTATDSILDAHEQVRNNDLRGDLQRIVQGQTNSQNQAHADATGQAATLNGIKTDLDGILSKTGTGSGGVDNTQELNQLDGDLSGPIAGDPSVAAAPAGWSQVPQLVSDIRDDLNRLGLGVSPSLVGGGHPLQWSINVMGEEFELDAYSVLADWIPYVRGGVLAIASIFSAFTALNIVRGTFAEPGA